MPHREFVLNPTTADPPTFSIAGRDFKCLANPPAGVMTDLVISADGSPSAQTAGLVGFIKGCLSDAESDAFSLLIYDKDTIIPVETLMQIAEWLVTEYTDRPTTPSSSSQPGSTPTAATSEDGASLPTPNPLQA